MLKRDGMRDQTVPQIFKSGIFLSIFFLLFLSLSKAYADTGDNCSNAENITINTGTTTKSGKLLYKWSQGWQYNGRYYYYKITAPSDGTLTISSSGFNSDTDAKLYNSNCSTTLVKDESSNDNISLTYHITASNTYKLLLYNWEDNKDDFTLTISFSPDNNNSDTINSIDDLCYDNAQTSGMCFGVVNINCTVTTPIRNTGDNNLTDVHIALGTTSIFSAFSDCGVNGASGNCSDANGMSIMNFSLFNDGIYYDLPDYAPNQTQTVYASAMFSFLQSDYDWVATYTKDGKTYQGVIHPCGSTTVSSGERDFTLRHQVNLKGDVKVIGNTVLCKKVNGQCVETPNNKSNAEIDLQKAPQSSATLTIPQNATIEYARIYWQGRLKATSDDIGWDESSKEKASKIWIKKDGGNAIQLTADILDTSSTNASRYSYNPAYARIYHASADASFIVTGGGTYSIDTASFFTSTGETAVMSPPDGLGNYGAWTLVVVYKDPDSQKLKNISIFDGYKIVSSDSPSVNVSVSGFLTPTHGLVDSTLYAFAGEGDRYITGDRFKIAGATQNKSWYSLNGDNAFDSSITVPAQRVPDLTNNNGIDIQYYNVGTSNNGKNIITNSETGANFQFTSSGDTYFPSLIVFSTELYQPRVCYYIDTIKDDDNNTIFENKQFVSKIDPNKNYHFNLWVANMKKTSSDTNIENAQNVQVYVKMKNGFNYKTDSTLIKNIGNTSYFNVLDAHTNNSNDLGDFNSETNRSVWRLGVGANSSQGGVIEAASSFNDDTKKAYIKLQGQFTDIDNNISNINLSDYYDITASFSTDSITITPENSQPIEQCIDLNLSALVNQPPIGSFNVVNQNFNSNYIPADVNSSVNSLYSQIVGKPFTVKILSLDKIIQGTNSINLKNFDNGPYGNDINISLINTPNYNSCGNDEECKENRCKNALSVYTLATNFNFGDNKTVTKTFTVNKAFKNISFKINFIDSNGKPKSACSFDSFAIRPKTYIFDINETHLIGGKKYSLDINATKWSSPAKALNYTTIADINMSLVIPSGCSLPSDINKTSITFGNGSASLLTQSSNIGDYNISIVDNKWTLIDQNKKSDNTEDCIKNSFSNTPNSQGKIGCNTGGYKVFTFLPKEFKNTLSISNGASNFTYISNKEKMSAKINYTVTASLENGSIATNYTKNCYANDINTTLQLLNFPTDENLILFFDDKNSTTYKEGNTSNSAIFKTTEGNFTAGVAHLSAKFNFPRRVNKTINPFKITKNDFNISTVIDTKGTNGSDFSRSSNQTVTFYYARIHSPDYSIKGDTINAKIYREIYCKDCNKTIFTSVGDESLDSIYWYINKDENSINDGKINNFITSSKIDYITPSTTVNQGVESDTVKYNAGIYPYKERIEINASSWLIYNPYDQNASTNGFEVEFFGGSGWAGIGPAGKTVDLNISTKNPKRIEW